MSGYGTGVVIAKRGEDAYVLTAGHVLRGARAVTVGSMDGWIAAKVLAVDDSGKGIDLALLRVRLRDEVTAHEIAVTDALPGTHVRVQFMRPDLGARIYAGVITSSPFVGWPYEVDRPPISGASGGGVFIGRALLGIVWGGKRATLYTPASRIGPWLREAGLVRDASSTPDPAPPKPAVSSHDAGSPGPVITSTGSAVSSRKSQASNPDRGPPKAHASLLSATVDAALTILPWALGAGATGGTGALAIWAARIALAALRRRKQRLAASTDTPDKTANPYLDKTTQQTEAINADNTSLRQTISELRNDVAKVREYIQVPVEKDTELYRKALDIVAETEHASPTFQRFYKLVEEHYKLLKSGQGA